MWAPCSGAGREAGLSKLVAVALDALPEDPHGARLVGLLDSADAMSVPMRVRFATFSRTGWNENWFVRLIREIPASRVPLAVGALAVLPPADMTTTRQWWRHCAAVFERKRRARQEPKKGSPDRDPTSLRGAL